MCIQKSKFGCAIFRPPHLWGFMLTAANFFVSDGDCAIGMTMSPVLHMRIGVKQPSHFTWMLFFIVMWWFHLITYLLCLPGLKLHRRPSQFLLLLNAIGELAMSTSRACYYKYHVLRNTNKGQQDTMFKYYCR